MAQPVATSLEDLHSTLKVGDQVWVTVGSEREVRARGTDLSESAIVLIDQQHREIPAYDLRESVNGAPIRYDAEGM